MQVHWRAISEEQPGPKWLALFNEYWPSYRDWWLRDGDHARPTYTQCRAALKKHMPGMMGLWEQLCDLTGGGDHEARFLSFYCPPPYLTGCSQAIWPGAEPVLVRNYDYNPAAFDSLILHTSWNGRRVMGVSDGLLGLVDGVNDAGLAVSLTFGGRPVVGDGFGVPIILRHILQTCDSVPEASRMLARIPTHMSYNVTLIDQERRFVTALVAPDRPPVVTNAAVATNHQWTVEWQSHARFTATVERERFLLQRLMLHTDTQEKFINSFLRPPLYSTAYNEGFGTLYTAVYRPRLKEMEIRWPDTVWDFQMDDFIEQTRNVHIPGFGLHKAGSTSEAG